MHAQILKLQERQEEQLQQLSQQLHTLHLRVHASPTSRGAGEEGAAEGLCVCEATGRGWYPVNSNILPKYLMPECFFLSGQKLIAKIKFILWV